MPVFDVAEERKKILDGTYPSRVQKGKQRKHVFGTREFEQNLDKMQRLSPGSRPAILDADAAELVLRYKGTGSLYRKSAERYPREIVDANVFVGKTWVKRLQKYVNTKRFEIIYASDGVHVVPTSDYHSKG